MADGKDTPGYCLVNGFEPVVQETIRTVMAKQDMCRCEKCFLDVCAIVYNKGFVHFATTPAGALMAKLPAMSNEKHVQLLVAVGEAVEIVRKAPMH